MLEPELLNQRQKMQIAAAATRTFEILVRCGALPQPEPRKKSAKAEEFRRRELLGEFDYASLSDVPAGEFGAVLEWFERLGGKERRAA